MVLSAMSLVEDVIQKGSEIIGKLAALSVTGSDVKFVQLEEKTRATLDALYQDVNRLEQLSLVGKDKISKARNATDGHRREDDHVVSNQIKIAERKILAVNNSREM